MMSIDNIKNIKKYNDLLKLYRITALVLRFIENIRRSLQEVCRTKKSLVRTMEKYVTSGEMKRSKKLWIQANQKFVESEKDFENLQLQLNVKKDADDIIRTFSRMKNACLPAETKAPVLLSKEHRLSELIILYCHSKVYHRGVRQTLNEFRASYWVTRGRSYVKKLLRTCIVCRKLNARPFKYPGHSELPVVRFDDRSPFSSSGVDHLGPLYCSPVYGKKDEAFKAYVVLYTCLSTRAVLLDVVQSTDAKSFINSFRRFIARRGCPAIMLSDNGSAFTAAETQKFVANKFIEWRFNIPLAPWQGGIWERLVSCVKRCIKKTVGVRRISYVELQTLIAEIEGILNNRPICQDYDDEIENVLTPNHLLYGRRLESVNEKNSCKVDGEDRPELGKREKHLTQLLTYFWDVWRKEYLTALRESQKLSNTKGDTTLAVDDVVTIYDKHQPRHLWKLGRVIELIKGNDQKVRAAKIKFGGSGAIGTRPLNKLCPLEMRQIEEKGQNIDIGGNKLSTDTKIPRVRRQAAISGEIRRKFSCE